MGVDDDIRVFLQMGGAGLGSCFSLEIKVNVEYADFMYGSVAARMHEKVGELCLIS